MRTDVLELVRDAGDLTHVVVLTYNLDFRFVQHLLRPMLRRCGHPSLTIFADARRAAESFARGGAQLGGLGVRYRVVGVPMPAGAAFHPKAVLLSGHERGTLLVGSGNLGFGGWRENGEIWLRRDSDRHGTSTFAAFREYLRRVTVRVPLQDAITGEVESAFDGATHPWAQTMEPPGGLLGRVGSGPSLLESMRAELAGRSITGLTIAAPYFDDQAAAVTASSAAFGPVPVPTELLVPRRGNNLREAAAAALPAHVTLSSTAFTRGVDPNTRHDVFLHAKFYAFRSASRVHLFVGSANASWAALMSSGEHGNAELLAYVELGAAEYREQILQELTITAEPPELSAALKDDEVEPSARLQILAARLAAGVLRVAFAATYGVTVTTCLLDGVEVRGFVIRAPILEVRVSGPPPRSVGLQGILDGVTITSPLGWVDQEDALQVGSTARALAEELRKTGGTVIDFGVWTDVLAVFCQHLQVLPPSSVGPGPHDGRPPTDADLTFTRDDVFVDKFEFPPDGPSLTSGLHGRATLLQQLMLRWFHGLQGAAPLEEDEGPGPAIDEPGDEDNDPSPPPPAPPPSARQPSQAERRRFDRLVTRLQESMTDPEFLQRRPTSTLAADLCLAAALLRTGLREQWIDADRFFSVTHDIWRALFLSTPGAPGSGAIELRHRHAPDPAGFRRVLGAEHVTAALAAWALTDLPPASAGPRHARFVLSALLSVARTEWLWVGGDLGVVARELGNFLRISGEDRERVAQAWQTLTRRGRALGRLEQVLRAQPLATWRARVIQRELACGELLWQDGAGWCITTEACRRVDGVNVPVLKLQGDNATINFRAAYTVPIRDLIPPELAAPIAEIVADFGAP